MSLVLFGATGDLVGKKIVPALFHLFKKHKLPTDVRVVAFARREMTSEDYREYVAEILRTRVPESTSQEVKPFLELFEYEQGQFDTPEDYASLATRLANHETNRGDASGRLLYLAVPPELTPTIFTHLGEAGLSKPRNAESWTRIIVEKPIGDSGPAAEHIEGVLCTHFHESQIYRIDHYLAKEMVQNIMAFRFSNSLFEQSWNTQFIERIDIKLWESLGVEKRGSFYDNIGTLRDVGQNHLLQMLAFVTMDHPQNFTAEAIRDHRARILETLPVPSDEEIRRTTFRAQYDGYRAIEGVAPASMTETYFKITTELNTPRWKGVPITMESGKRMGPPLKEIRVTFRRPIACLCPSDQDEHQRNVVTFALEPQEAVTLQLWSKKPGLELDIQKQTVDVMLREPGARQQYVEEYEKLFLDSILGDQTLFVDHDEVQAMWRFIDPIVDAWSRNIVPLAIYAPDTPQAAELAAAATMNPAPNQPVSQHVGIMGLGKMGANLARRLVDQDWNVVGWNRTTEVTRALAQEGIVAAPTVRELVSSLPSPRTVWLMLPAGAPVDDALFGTDGLIHLLEPGDIVIDGGNSLYKDAPRRAVELAKKGIRFLDCGTSGGPGGARNGACLMIGGRQEAYRQCRALFNAIATKDGAQFFEGHGAGHFVKMVHNGIEYGMMQAIAEGFEILRQADYTLDLKRVADIYAHGSVIESRLIEWLRSALALHGPELTGVSSTVAHTGEGAWTVQTAKEMGIEAAIIEGALEFRKQSGAHPRYAGKILSALREQFGGHRAQ